MSQSALICSCTHSLNQNIEWANLCQQWSSYQYEILRSADSHLTGDQFWVRVRESCWSLRLKQWHEWAKHLWYLAASQTVQKCECFSHSTALQIHLLTSSYMHIARAVHSAQRLTAVNLHILHSGSERLLLMCTCTRQCHLHALTAVISDSCNHLRQNSPWSDRHRWCWCNLNQSVLCTQFLFLHI